MVLSHGQPSKHTLTCRLLSDLLNQLQLLLLEMLLDVVVALRVIRNVRVHSHPLQIVMAIVCV